MSALRAGSLLRTSCRATTNCAFSAPLPGLRLATVTARQHSSGTTPPQPDATSSSPVDKGKGNGKWALAAVAVAAAGLAAYIYTDDVEAARVKPVASKILSSVKHFKPTVADYQKVYNAIAADLEKDENYDDGSYGPVLVRLAWHASGTYDAKTGTGGSNGATMRFAPEAEHGANAGLVHARNYMDAIHKKFPWITYSDLWTLGGVVAVQELGGPHIPWRPGRTDCEAAHCTPDGRLPDGDKGANHLRDIFYRMGFNDQEIVALAGAHALGRCHRERSGYDGPWQHAPTSFTNAYYDLLLHEKWQWRKWDGPAQYTDKATGTLMMLPADMALIQDKAMRKYVEKYAASEETFFSDFSKAFAKLLELGVPEDNFKQKLLEGKPVILKTTAEQGL